MIQNGHGNNLVAVSQLNAANAGRVAADENANLGNREADTFTAAGRQHNVVFFGTDTNVNQLIALVKLHGDFAVALNIDKIHQRVAADIALRSGKHDGEILALFFVFRQFHNRGNGFAFVKRQQVDERLAFGSRRAERQFVNLHLVNKPLGREEQDRRVR